MMKNSNKLWAKVLASVAVGGVILSGLSLSAMSATGPSPLVTKASAGVAGGGSSGGGGGGGGSTGARWVQIPKAKLDNGSIQNIPGIYQSSDVCKDAIAYFGLVPNVVSDTNATSGSWYYSFNGVGTMNGVSFAGGPNVANRIADNVGWSYQEASDYMYQKNFICLDNPNRVTQNEWRYEVRDTGSSSASLNTDGTYILSTEIDPQPINIGTDAEPKMVTDPVGAQNMNFQSTFIRTNYGLVWDAYSKAISANGSESKNIVAEFKPKFAAALEKDKTANRADLNLNNGSSNSKNNNQAGLAEGGILNISEYTKTASASASTTKRDYRVWRCGWDYWSKSGWQATGCQAVGGTINHNNLPLAGKDAAKWVSTAQKDRYKPTTYGQTAWSSFATTVGSPRTTQRQTGFWQVISAHCNAQAILDLRAAMGADLSPMDSGDATREISGLMRTKLYAQQPSVLPMGDGRATKQAQKATSRLSFYDKECPFDCTPNRTGAGATDANGAKSNVSTDDSARTVKGLYGSKTISKNQEVPGNSSYSEMFRDNEDRTIRPDVWYPISGEKGIRYGGEAPKSTLITRWAGGTPTLASYGANGVRTGGEFEASAMVLKNEVGDERELQPIFSSTVIRDGKLENILPLTAAQKGFDTAKESSFRNATAAQFRGLVDQLTVKSTWASTSGKPQALQVAWEYEADVASNVPTMLSFAPGGSNVRYGALTTRLTGIDGRCWGEFGTTAQTTRPLAQTELRGNTGTGSTTKFTVPNGEVSSRNLVLNFVRGTGE